MVTREKARGGRRWSPWLLDLGRGVGFFVTLFALYSVAAVAFFSPAMRWRERLGMLLLRTLLAGLLCLLSGFLFAIPADSSADVGRSLLRTLPVQLFVWTIPVIAVLSGLSWYFLCGCPLWSYQHYFACR